MVHSMGKDMFSSGLIRMCKSKVSLCLAAV